jgi:RNA polymerase sigma factor (sigma-70 family)
MAVGGSAGDAPGAADTSPDARGWDEFAPLYDAHHERLYRVALLLCHGDTAMAEDAVTETFLRVYEQWVAGRVDDNFFPYARQVLVNQVLGNRRQHVSTPGAGTDRGDRPLDESLADASATFKLLEQLAPDQRTAVVLRYFEDLSYDQIASTMGVSPGAAKAEVSVGLQRMRDLMAEEQSS